MRILKFGGSSVANSQRIKNVIKIVKGENLTEGGVVFSALGGVTNDLILMGKLAEANDLEYKKLFTKVKQRHLQTAQELGCKEDTTKLSELFDQLQTALQGIFLLKEFSDCSCDFVASFGERLSCTIIADAFLKRGFRCSFLDARELVLTDGTFKKAFVNFGKTYANIQKYFRDRKEVQIITGFIARSGEGKTTTIGRGGSDYTASIFAAALGCKIVEIFTDVQGIKTANPREVEGATTIENLTYNEAIELSHFGAKVIYPPAIQPAMDKKIPIAIKDTFNHSFTGTIISKTKKDKGQIITGVSSIDEIALVRVQGWGMAGVTGIAARIFRALASKNINVILIAQASSEYSVCFAIESESLIIDSAKKALFDEFEPEIKQRRINPITIEKNFSSLSVIGENMRHRVGISGQIFNALGKNGINVVAIAQGLSELNISMVVPKKDRIKALNVIHSAFFNDRDVNIFLLGTGQIGSTLLAQIEYQKEFLRKEHNFHIHLRALANTSMTKFGSIDFDKWENSLNSDGSASDTKAFVNKMIELNLPNSIFVDCTASSDVIRAYPKILKASISIVTPNKKANSSTYRAFSKLNTLAKRHKTKFLYETNVGAGLPIISTLDDLLKSGDKIKKIEAVLSGTISYIFNNLSATSSFSTIVKRAKELGFTEPDPRDDLSGADIARKVLILMRVMGIQVELEDIKIEKILPKRFEKIKSVEEFLEKLSSLDEEFGKRVAAAEKAGKKLKYIATIEKKAAKVSITPVDESSPFYTLKGSDNMVVFTTERYSKETPLIVRGPGAGAEVTAAGVFADIIKIVNYLLF